MKLNHPTAYQLKKVFIRGYAALDIDKAISSNIDSCHTCASLKKLPKHVSSFSTSSPCSFIGQRLASDVLKRSRQLILLSREAVSSYTTACIIRSEDADQLQDALIRTILPLHSVNGPPCTVRVDPAPGFQSLHKSQPLKKYGISIELGRFKNLNKNPVAEKAVQELEDELLRIDPTGGPITEAQLSVALSCLNARIRLHGLSASEVFIRRNQYTAEELNNNEKDIISAQHTSRSDNHAPSHKTQQPDSSTRCRTYKQLISPLEGSIVYLKNDRSKMYARPMYMITKREGDQLHLKKFVNNQLRNREYIVHASDTFCIPTDVSLKSSPKQPDNGHEDMCCPALPLPSDDNVNIYPPAVPVMDTPVTDPAPGPSEPADASIAPEPDSWDDPLPDPQPEDSSSENDTVTEPVQPPSPPAPRRSTRNRVPNSRLKDYVWLLADQWVSDGEDGEEDDATPRRPNYAKL